MEDKTESNGLKDVIKKKKEIFRVEIRKKNTELLFNTKRSKLLENYINPNENLLNTPPFEINFVNE